MDLAGWIEANCVIVAELAALTKQLRGDAAPAVLTHIADLSHPCCVLVTAPPLILRAHVRELAARVIYCTDPDPATAAELYAGLCLNDGKGLPRLTDPNTASSAVFIRVLFALLPYLSAEELTEVPPHCSVEEVRALHQEIEAGPRAEESYLFLRAMLLIGCKTRRTYSLMTKGALAGLGGAAGFSQPSRGGLFEILSTPSRN